MTFLLASEASALATPAAFVLIGLGAFSLPILARRIGLPPVVLEIAFGVVIGPEVLALINVADEATFELFAELGLLLLMFLAGFEVDFERIERQGVTQIVVGLVLFGLFLGAAWYGAGFFDLDNDQQRLFLALLVSAASVGIVVPALRETGITSGALGQTILITALIAEFLSLIGILVLGTWVDQGFAWGLLGLPALFGVMVLTLWVIRRAAWWYPERFQRLFATHDPDEMGIRASLALLFVFVGIAGALGVEGILGAFLAGALFAFIFRDTGRLEERLSGIAFGFFVPIFFINVGIRFPLGRLTEGGVLGTALGLILMAVLIKVIPSLLLMLRFTLREALASGILLAGQLSVVVALAELGLDLDLLSPALEAGAILLVAVTAVLSPVLFRLLIGKRVAEAAPERR